MLNYHTSQAIISSPVLFLESFLDKYGFGKFKLAIVFVENYSV